MVEGSASFFSRTQSCFFQSEESGYYATPKDLYGFFHNYERDGNDLGNVERLGLRDANNVRLEVVIIRKGTNPAVDGLVKDQIDASKVMSETA